MSESILEPRYAYFYRPHWDTFEVIGRVASLQNTFDCKVQCKPRPMLIICEGKGRCDAVEYLVLPFSTKKKDGDFSVGKVFSEEDSHAMLKCVEWIGDTLIKQRNGKKFKHCDRQLYDGLVKLAMDHRRKTTLVAASFLCPDSEKSQPNPATNKFEPLYKARKRNAT